MWCATTMPETRLMTYFDLAGAEGVNRSGSASAGV
jgi:hypothetical protein